MVKFNPKQIDLFILAQLGFIFIKKVRQLALFKNLIYRYLLEKFIKVM